MRTLYFAAVVTSFFLSSFFLLFSSPVLSGERLDVYHTSTHDVVLVRIQNTCLKCAARGSRKYRTQNLRKNRNMRTMAQIVGQYLGN